MRRLGIAITALALACTGKERIEIGTVGEGGTCARTADCVPGNVCTDKVCTKIPPPDISGRAGSACSADKPCAADLCCGNQMVCRARLEGFPAGMCGFPGGAACGLSADCAPGLVCNGPGQCVDPASGMSTKNEGEPCADLFECRRPFVCGVTNVCEKIPLFGGVACRRSEEEVGAFRGYFEVPRGAPLDEFYRLPFPNDVRVLDDRIDLAGHATPGEVLGADFTKLYLGALEQDLDGFGLSQPVFLRFSDDVLRTTLSSTAAEPTVMLVDLDAAGPSYRARIPVQLQYRQRSGQFMCGNALGVAPHDGRPLRPRTTYAVIVSSAVRSVRMEAPIHDRDFAAMLAATPPEAALARAYERYAPLRRFLADENLAPSAIATAAVFTTGDPGKIVPRIREAVRAHAAPALSNLTRCANMVSSPCAVAMKDRGCGPANASFVELHVKLTNHPVLQKGVRPYQSAGADGTEGSIQTDSAGLPVVQGTEEMCLGITLPSQTPMPGNGFPVAIFAHGTGGDFTSGLRSVAADLAAEGIAVITFDNVMHGPRQGLPPPAWQDPGQLFFNALNPRAARDNVFQGAADIMYLVRVAETAVLARATTGLGADARFDPSRILFYGHSQGTVIAPPALAHEPKLRAAVLTGAGAEIGLTLLSKQKPNDISQIVKVVFADQSLTRVHPMIGLLGWFFGPTDALPYAPILGRNRPAGRGPLDFLHVYGVGDGFTPDVTQAALLKAGGYPIVGTVVSPVEGVPTAPSPARANFSDATLGAVQFAPPTNMNGEQEYDGHFVGTRDMGARTTIRTFLRTAAQGTMPAEIRR